MGWLLNVERGAVVYDAPVRVRSGEMSRTHAKSASRCPAILNLESRYVEVKCPFDLRLGFVRDEEGRPGLRNLLGPTPCRFGARERHATPRTDCGALEGFPSTRALGTRHSKRFTRAPPPRRDGVGIAPEEDESAMLGTVQGMATTFSDAPGLNGKVNEMCSPGGLTGSDEAAAIILPDGRMAGWPDGRMAGWPDGRMAGWPDGRMAGWPDGRTCVCAPA